MTSTPPSSPPSHARRQSTSSPLPHNSGGNTSMQEVDLDDEGQPPLRQRIAAATSNGSDTSFLQRRRSSILVGQRSLDIMAMEDPSSKGPRFVMFIIRQYRSWGYFIAQHDWKAIIICLIISAIGLYKVFITPQQNDITGYTPTGARSRQEYTRYMEFFSQDGPGVTVYIFALAKDGGSMLRGTHLNETLKVLDYANRNVSMFDDGKGKNVSFSEFCFSFCNINEPVTQFATMFNHQQQRLARGEELEHRINLTYPISSIFGTSLTLQQNFFGVEFHEGDDIIKYLNTSSAEAAFLDDAKNSAAVELLSSFLQDTFETPVNSSNETNGTEPRLTNMRSAKIVVLHLRAAYKQGWTRNSVKRYELDMVDAVEKNFKTEHLKLYVLSQSYVETEMVKAGIALVPKLALGFVIMLICAVVSVVSRAYYMHQHSLPKIVLAFAACMLPFMSCATALGLMFAFGVRFASILCLIPFLVLSIGVDSSYLMIHEWQRVIKHCRDHPNRRNCNVGFRVSEVLSEVGPAVLISTLTNLLADAVGSLTSAPELALLCIGNMLAMLVAFFYQMTFYAGLMSLVGRYEVATERKERRELQASLRNPAGMPKHQLTRQHSRFHDHTKHAMSKSMHIYVNFVSRKPIALATIGLYLIYLAVSIWGICLIQINLTTQKLFTQDSPLLSLDKLRVKYQVPVFTQATVFVNRPGNLSEPKQLERMNDFVQAMEKISGSGFGSWGPVGTLYFIRDFLSYEKSILAEQGPLELPPPTVTTDLIGAVTSSNLSTSLAPFATATPTTTSLPTNGTLIRKRKSRQAEPSGIAQPVPFSVDELRNFISWPEYTFFSGFIQFDDERDRLQKFFFTTGYFGRELEVWTRRGVRHVQMRDKFSLLDEWRAVVDRFNRPNVEEGFEGFDSSVFHEDAIFLDLIDSIPSNTWQSVLATLVCMAAICFLFLNSIFTVIIATSCVLSICVGILGILSWWHIDLDPISMAAMIISIGFSVDIPAHVSYHYYKASAKGIKVSPEMKLVNCLSSVAFPALQAALSTILCVLSLAFVHIYMAEVFLKTMVLCVILCNLHGLVFLPAFLIIFDSSVQMIRRLSEHAKSTRTVHAAKPGGGSGIPMGEALPRKAPLAAGSNSTSSSSGSSSNRSNPALNNPPAAAAATTTPHMARGRSIAKPLPLSTSKVCDRPPLNFD